VLTMMEPEDNCAGVVTPVVNKKKSGEDGDGGKKKKRKVPPLPLELYSLTDCDCSKFDLVLEIDKTHRSATFGQEFLVAKSVRVPSTNGKVDDPPTVFNLGDITVDNLRKLCTNIGVSNAGSLSKFNCRKAVAIYFWYQESLSNIGIRPTSHASGITSSVCRAVNVVFSADFIEDFKMVNDQKSRQDHGTKNTYKAFWICAALAYNSCMETGEDETEIVLVEKATSSARNGEIVARPGARPANHAILFPGSNKENNNNDNSDSTEDAEQKGKVNDGNKTNDYGFFHVARCSAQLLGGFFVADEQ
jgi:hypothetical protein